jgi:hypothetical protein
MNLENFEDLCQGLSRRHQILLLCSGSAIDIGSFRLAGTAGAPSGSHPAMLILRSSKLPQKTCNEPGPAVPGNPAATLFTRIPRDCEAAEGVFTE